MAADDESLRKELKSYGVDVGPITSSTKSVYVNKLKRLSLEKGAKPKGSSNSLKQPQRAEVDSNKHSTFVSVTMDVFSNSKSKREVHTCVSMGVVICTSYRGSQNGRAMAMIVISDISIYDFLFAKTLYADKGLI